MGRVTALRSNSRSASPWGERPCPAAGGTKLTKGAEELKLKEGALVKKKNNQDPERFEVLCDLWGKRHCPCQRTHWISTMGGRGGAKTGWGWEGNKNNEKPLRIKELASAWRRESCWTNIMRSISLGPTHVCSGYRNSRNQTQVFSAKEIPWARWGGWLGIKSLNSEFKARIDQVWRMWESRVNSKERPV